MFSFRSLFIGLCACFMALTTSAQVSFGLRAGASTTELSMEDLNVFDENGVDDLLLSLRDAHHGAHIGLFLQAKMGNFVIMPEVTLNSNRVDFQLDNVVDSSTTLFTEKYQYLDIPVLVGMKFGPLRLNAGPVGHVFLNSASGLDDLEGYREDFKNLTLGWQGGIGLDIWKLLLDVRYEGNFNRFGDHFTFFGNEYQFSQRPARVIFSLGFKFGK